MAVSTVAVRAGLLRTSRLGGAARSAALRNKCDDLGAGAAGTRALRTGAGAVRTRAGRDRAAGAVGARAVSGTVGPGAVGNGVSVATMGRNLDNRALGARADRDQLSLAVIRGTPAVLPRLVNNRLLLATAVSSDEEGLVVPPVVALLGLVNDLTGTASTGAELGDVLFTALARALLSDVDPLVVTVAAIDLDEDEDGAVRALSVALSVDTDLDGGDGSSGSGLSVSDGSGEGGGDSGLVGDGLSNRVSDSGTSTGGRDVDGQETASGNSLTGLETVEAAITTTEVVLVARALNITLVDINTAGVIGINLVTAVASTGEVSIMFCSRRVRIKLTYRKHRSRHGQCRKKHRAQDPSERWSQQARRWGNRRKNRHSRTG